MPFVRFRGKTKLMHFRKSDTTAASSLRDGSLVGLTDSGNLSYLAKDSTDKPVGVCRLRVTATDTSSWPGAPLVPVEVPVENAVEWLIDTDSDGGAADSDVGQYCAVDTAGGNNRDSESVCVDINDTASRNVFITGVVSATKIIGVLGKTVWNRSVGQASDTFDTGA